MKVIVLKNKNNLMIICYGKPESYILKQKNLNKISSI